MLPPPVPATPLDSIPAAQEMLPDWDTFVRDAEPAAPQTTDADAETEEADSDPELQEWQKMAKSGVELRTAAG